MKRQRIAHLTVILVILLLAAALTPALAGGLISAGPVPVVTPTPAPEPIFLHLQWGQTVYMLCAEGLHLEQFGKEAGAGECGP